MSFIKDRFDQRDNIVYVNCEQLLLKAAADGDVYKKNFKLLLVSMAPIFIHES